MNLSFEDRLRFWKALAAYIKECNELAQTDQELSEYYHVEAREAAELRDRIQVRE